MATAVLIPWRPGDAHREAALRHITGRYHATHPSWQVVIGRHDGDWVKAHAVAGALAQTDADTLLIADADVWCDGLQQAVDALGEWPWAIPHHTVYRLTEAATAAVLAGGPLEGETTQRPYKGYPGGGFMALSRGLYERVPLDPRFVGWGQEDSSWHLALRRIAGMGWRGRADCWHLWHEPQPRLSRQVGSEASGALLDRYQQANTPEKMTALLAEVTCGEDEDRSQPERFASAPAVV